MNKFFIILIILSLFSCSTQQEFEGFVEYEVVITILDSQQVEQSSLENIFGNQVTTYHKNGMLKDVSNATIMPYQLFLPKKKTLYSFGTANSKIVEAYDLTSKSDQYDFEIKTNADTILNYPCNLLIARRGKIEKQYYFTPKLYLNPNHYKGCTLWNKYEIIEKTQGVVLKLIIITDAYKLESIPLKITQVSLNDSIFKIPENGKIKNISL